MKTVIAAGSVVLSKGSEGSCPGFSVQDATFCEGLTKQPNVLTAEACQELCCNDTECDTWHFCPERDGESGGGCSGWGSSRCHIGKASSCSSKSHWVGERKGVPPPPPSPSPPPAPSPTPSPTPGKPVTRKRGVSGFTGKTSSYGCDDAKLLGLHDSWHYTWVTNPSQYNHCNGQQVSSEFVPMVNGIGQAQNMVGNSHWVKSWSENNVHFLLGYNEPDFGNGHNHPHACTPAEAAKDWPYLQEVAAMFDPPLELVAPAVASGQESGGKDCWDDNGHSTWLDEFFGNCSDVVKECDPSLIKYIAMHDYHGNVSQLRKRVSGAVQRYGNRKVWLTEFAITDWRDPPQRDAQDAYMKEVLPYLDNSPDVFRYAWFSIRNGPNNQNGGSNLLAADGSATLTSTGRIYMGDALDLVVV